MGIDVFVENDELNTAPLASTSGYPRLMDLFRKTLKPWQREVPALHALFGAGAIEAKDVTRLMKDVDRARATLARDGTIAPAKEALDALTWVATVAKRKKRGVAHDGPTLVPLKQAAPRRLVAAPPAIDDDGGFTRDERARFPFSIADGASEGGVVIPGGAWHGVWYRHNVVFSSGRGGHNKMRFELTVRDGVLQGKGTDTQYKAFRLEGACDARGGVRLVQRYSRADHAELRVVRYRARYDPTTKLIAGLLRWGEGGRDDSLGGVFLAPQTVPLKPLIALLEEFGGFAGCESAVRNLLFDRASAKWLLAQLDAIAQGRAPAKHADPETNHVLRDVRAVARHRRFGSVVRDVLIASLARGA